MTTLTPFRQFLVLTVGLLGLTAHAERITELLDTDGMVMAEQSVDGDIRYLEARRLPTQYPPAFKAPKLPKDADPQAYTYRFHNDPDSNRRVQPDGTTIPIDRSRPIKPLDIDASRATTTVDSLTLTTYEGQYAPYLPLFLQGLPSRYTLSDGSNFFSGSSSVFRGKVQLVGIAEQNGTITYTFERFGDQLFLDVVENAQFENATAFDVTLDSQFTLEAAVGSNTAVLNGELLVTNTDPVSITDDRFSRISAVVGSTVPYTMTMTNNTSVWTTDSFDSGFSYSITNGAIDFANPTTSPAIVDLQLSGPQQLPPDISTQLQAFAVYENGEELQVNSSAVWSSPNDDLFDLTPDGIITTSSPPPQDTDVVVFAQFQNFQGELAITLIGEDTLAQSLDGWSTYQRGPSHAGATDLSTEQSLFNVLWSVPIPLSSFYNQPVADNNVVVIGSANTFFGNDDLERMFAFDALDGSLLWGKSFPGVRQTNGPALAYGNVIVVSESNNSQDTIQSINALTGAVNYTQSFPNNQVEGESPAPTVYEGDIYVRGGFSSVFRMNLFTGELLWSNDDTNPDRRWTPSVDEQYVYEYDNERLSVIDRATGELAFQLEQPIDSFSSSEFAVILNEDSSAAFVQYGGDVSKFDLVDKRHVWTADANYIRQPAYSNGRLYTYTSNEFVALDAEDGSVLWSYDPPVSGNFSEDIVITNNHAFVGHGNRTIAIDLNSEEEVWDFNSRGRLSISGETLYIVGSDLTLTAIQIPGMLNVVPESIEIVGPTTVEEDSVTQYRAIVTYADGRVRDRTLQVQWSMKPSLVSTLGSTGRFGVGELLVPQDTITLSALFSEGGGSVEVTLDVQLVTLLSNEAFALRNLEVALSIKESLLEQLADATQREQSARAALESLTDPDAQFAFDEVVSALEQGTIATGAIDSGVTSLAEAIAILSGDTRPWNRRSR